MLLKSELKQLDRQVHYFFRGGWVVGWVGGWGGGWSGGWVGGRVGGVEEWRIKLSQLSTWLKLKLKLSLAIVIMYRSSNLRNQVKTVGIILTGDD